MIELHDITKRFGPLTAVDGVSLEIPPAKVLGLLGENGAGKSTLMHILLGIVKPDAGEVLADEKPIHSPRDAARAGIGIVYQHFKLVPTLNALENMALFVRQSPRRLRGPATDWLARLRWTVPLERPVGVLSVGEQQRVEIIKALLTIERAAGARGEKGGRSPTLVLDEPTAVLTPQEAAELFAAIRHVRDAGTAVVFISHKLDEVRRICDRIAILRRGRMIHAGPLAELSAESIAEKMVGARVEMPHLARDSATQDLGPAAPAARTNLPSRAPLLSLQNLSTRELKSVCLDLHPHEILGIAGVDGNGQSHLVQAILGTRRPAAGTIHLIGRDVAGISTRRRLDQIAFIAEDRQREALVLPLSIEDNLLLKSYREPPFSTWGWLRFGRWHAQARRLVAQCDIRASSPRETVARLSGGNQQKVVIARELFSREKPLVVAVNPTRGLDVGATAFVLRQLLAARERGAGILLIHPDLDELLAVSDRVAVLYNGTLMPTRWPETTRDAIGRMMLGLRDTEAA